MLAYLAARWKQDCVRHGSARQVTVRTDLSLAGTLATPCEACHKANDVALWHPTTPTAFSRNMVIINVVIFIIMWLPENKLYVKIEKENERGHPHQQNTNKADCKADMYNKITAIGLMFVNFTYRLSATSSLAVSSL